jgi:hypothetical protein
MPPDPGSPTHRYFNASPECWALFGEATAFQYEHPIVWGRSHQLLVDAYAVQHAGGSHPAKSVTIHLAGLHLVLVRGFPTAAVPDMQRHLADDVADWPRLEPPSDRGPTTILDVVLTGDTPAHTDTVDAWSADVWSAWASHHDAVATFASRHLDLPTPPPGVLRHTDGPRVSG